MDAMPDPKSKALALLLVATFGITLLLASCASVQSPESRTPAQLGTAPPEWRIGDRWSHSWTAGAHSGSKVSQVIAIQEVQGARYYVLSIDTLLHYYTLDLHWNWAVNPMDSKVVARAVPSQPRFLWPLTSGKTWEHRGVFEDQGKREPMKEIYKVVGIERVEVPAGSFLAFKIVRDAGNSGYDEYWYAPDIRWYVKWIGRRGKDEFQEVLQDYVPAPQPGRSAHPGERAPGASK